RGVGGDGEGEGFFVGVETVFDGDHEAAVAVEGVAEDEEDGAGEGGVDLGAEGALEVIFFVGGFIEVGDSEDGEAEVFGEGEERVEEGADVSGGGGVRGAEESGEWIEDEELGVV